MAAHTGIGLLQWNRVLTNYTRAADWLLSLQISQLLVEAAFVRRQFGGQCDIDDRQQITAIGSLNPGHALMPEAEDASVLRSLGNGERDPPGRGGDGGFAAEDGIQH